MKLKLLELIVFFAVVGQRSCQLETVLPCGRTSNSKHTTLQSPSKITDTVCEYTIKAYNAYVCQLLVEFQRFELMQPVVVERELLCIDSFTVGKFKLCGGNSQQHLHIPFGVTAGRERLALTFRLPNRWPQSDWDVRVTQLECAAGQRRTSVNLTNLRTFFSGTEYDVARLAPIGCDQYYTGATGHIKSFNFRNGNTYYMPNLEYVICIRAPPGTNLIEYTVNKFSLSAEVAGHFFDEYCRATVKTAARHSDYLMIPQASYANDKAIQPTYFCGQALEQGRLVLARAPFIMRFSSDGLWEGVENGFSISYRVRNVM